MMFGARCSGVAPGPLRAGRLIFAPLSARGWAATARSGRALTGRNAIMATKSRRRMSESERNEGRRADRERLQRAAEQLLSSEGWQRWVRVRSQNGLAKYSVNNQLLIALARPDATFVAGFRSWLELGYQVRKGEKAIWILAPSKIKERDRVSGEETGDTRTLFRAVPVFDRAQVTAGEHAVALEPLSGDSHEHLLEPLERFAGTLGFTVTFETINGPAGGWCDAKRKRIVVDAEQPANARVRVLIHEIAHAMGVDYQQYSRAQAEVIVDTVSFVVGSSVHLDLGGETIPYVAGWGENGALEAVSEFAATIDRMARQIEQALDMDRSPAIEELLLVPAM